MNIIQNSVKVLGITRPYRVELVSRVNEKNDALYWPTYSPKKSKLSHNIRIFLGGCSRSVESLIAHEFIHAWQEENKIIEVHGPEFIKQAHKMEYVLGISGIYLPDSDVEPE